MRSPAAAIAWELRRRHRWGLIVLTSYLLFLAIYRFLILAPGQRVTFEDARSFAFFVIVPLTSMFLYLLAMFSFGLAGDLAARQSMYPPRMFTLPVTSAALAGWPMFFGTASMAILWLVMRFVTVWPSGYDIPTVWPALLAASLLAWTQALTWMPYPLRGLRVIVTVLWLMVIDTVVLVALELKVSEGVMLALLAPHVPLAYLAARFAVSRARRGDVPDWQWASIAPSLLHRRNDFRSAARAQAWFEWRRHGRSLPVLVALVLPFQLALLFVFSETPVIVFETLVAVLLTPPFLAAFVAATLSKPNPRERDSSGVTPFMATRPLTSASLIAARLKMTIRSTLVTWLLVLIAAPLALRLSGTLPPVIEWFRQSIEAIGTPRTVAAFFLVLAMLLLSTWKQLVQSLFIGMSGREWLVKGSLFLGLSILAVILPFAEWILDRRRMAILLWDVVPWMVTVLACVKVIAAAWIAIRLQDSRLVSDRVLILGAACWSAAVFALYGVLVWLLPTIVIRRSFLAFVAILVIPLARLSAAPLALAWNRHR